MEKNNNKIIHLLHTAPIVTHGDDKNTTVVEEELNLCVRTVKRRAERVKGIEDGGTESINRKRV